ncbi:hypothetical protein OEZ85_010368 [Tetradesmus obliquus]|uniref:Uncharacterized protein n=1 Tax=Tetradesmus obliquus TaxID=3088 RepID=A0ABY8TM25_TETOB|nr:hypothetical protein OEZ85_010368 [Tetradesmus obliquus]
MGAYKVAGAPRSHWQICGLAAGFLLVTSLHFFLKQQQQQMSQSAADIRAADGLPVRPLRLAIFNQVNIHLHVVAGAMHVLRPLTSAAVTVFLPAAVLEGNLYGFMDKGWIGSMEGFIWRDVKQFDQEEKFDLVWFISPEWDAKYISSVAKQMDPKMALYYVHNGHMPDEDFDVLKRLSPELPLLTMAPHVAQYVASRLQENSSSTAAAAAPAAHEAEWVLPIFPYQPAVPCTQQQTEGSEGCLSGFSIAGSTDSSLRNYTRMWEQIRSYKQQQGAAALANFKLNILGQIMDNFTVPDDLRSYVQLHKSPSDPVFYEVNYHCYGIVPALSNPAYYTSKLTSAVITSLMTGVPVIADAAFLSAYSMMEPAAVFEQQQGESELDAMFRAAAQPAEQVLRTRAAVQQLRRKMNARASSLILRWLLDKGLVPDAASDIAKIL